MPKSRLVSLQRCVLGVQHRVLCSAVYYVNLRTSLDLLPAPMVKFHAVLYLLPRHVP